MTNFEFNAVGQIIFGIGQLQRLGALAASMGNRPMLIYNGPRVGDRIAELLGAAKTPPASVHHQQHEPTLSDVDQAVQTARAAACDCVVGAGGGSAIDCAKATAGLLGNGGSAVDYMEVVGKGQKITKPAVPWIAIPTTAGTGAEATRNAVIGLPQKQFKASIRSELLLARIALVDPELGVDVPPDVTARSGMDALCQVIESYTSTGANPITDALAIQGIGLAAAALPRAYADGHDIDAREDMALAALLSGITLTNAGLGAVHGFAAPLGANFPVPHGTICAALLPHVIAANVKALRADASGARVLSRYATVGRLLANDPRLPDDPAIDAAVRFTADLAQRLSIPPLRQFGLKQSDVPPMVALAKKASSMRYNPIVLSDEALSHVLSAAI